MFILTPEEWENDTGPPGWFAVDTTNDRGIIAYFQNSDDAEEWIGQGKSEYLTPDYLIKQQQEEYRELASRIQKCVLGEDEDEPLNWMNVYEDMWSGEHVACRFCFCEVKRNIQYLQEETYKDAAARIEHPQWCLVPSCVPKTEKNCSGDTE